MELQEDGQHLYAIMGVQDGKESTANLYLIDIEEQ